MAGEPRFGNRDAKDAHGGRGIPYGGQAERGSLLNETIITYLGNLSIATYKWFGSLGIAASNVETRNVKVETGRQRESKPAPFVKPNPKGMRHPRALHCVKGAPPARS